MLLWFAYFQAVLCSCCHRGVSGLSEMEIHVDVSHKSDLSYATPLYSSVLHGKKKHTAHNCRFMKSTHHFTHWFICPTTVRVLNPKQRQQNHKHWWITDGTCSGTVLHGKNGTLWSHAYLGVITVCQEIGIKFCLYWMARLFKVNLQQHRLVVSICFMY